jgi:hypothetical protein
MTSATTQPFRAKDLIADRNTALSFIAVLGPQMGHQRAPKRAGTPLHLTLRSTDHTTLNGDS